VIIISPLKDKTCVENQSVKFEIEINKPEFLKKLIWEKDGTQLNLQNIDDYELKENGNKYSLTIKKAKFTDEGKYTVKILDSDVNSSANLSVSGTLIITDNS
jgi:hypothetical protein